MINFYLSGFYTNFKLNKIYITYCLENKEKFYDNINIGAIYDNFPGCSWNGGRIMNYKYSIPTL